VPHDIASYWLDRPRLIDNAGPSIIREGENSTIRVFANPQLGTWPGAGEESVATCEDSHETPVFLSWSLLP